MEGGVKTPCAPADIAVAMRGLQATVGMTSVMSRPGVGNRENRESSRWAASLLGRSRITFFDICHVSPSSLKVGYTRSAF